MSNVKNRDAKIISNSSIYKKVNLTLDRRFYEIRMNTIIMIKLKELSSEQREELL